MLRGALEFKGVSVSHSLLHIFLVRQYGDVRGFYKCRDFKKANKKVHGF